MAQRFGILLFTEAVKCGDDRFAMRAYASINEPKPVPREGHDMCSQLWLQICDWLLTGSISALLSTPCQACSTVSNTKLSPDLVRHISVHCSNSMRAAVVFQAVFGGIAVVGPHMCKQCPRHLLGRACPSGSSAVQVRDPVWI